MIEFQLHTLEVVELRRRPSRLSRFGDAVARFLGKMAFFAMMFGLGAAGLAWWPPLPDPLGDLVLAVAAFCAVIMFLMGLAGLVVTVFTGGRKPLRDY
jgi:hypothetical protein